jgi:hypothetical protein
VLSGCRQFARRVCGANAAALQPNIQVDEHIHGYPDSVGSYRQAVERLQRIDRDDNPGVLRQAGEQFNFGECDDFVGNKHIAHASVNENLCLADCGAGQS